MKKKKIIITKRKVRETKILEGLKRISKEYTFSKLSDQEMARFEKAQFAEEQAKKTPFILGEPIVH